MANLLNIKVGDRVELVYKNESGSECGTVLAITESGIDLHGDEDEGLTVPIGDIEEVILL